MGICLGGIMKKNKGGVGRGQGRKPLSETGEVLKVRTIRLSDEDWKKCKLLGGSVWIRARIREEGDVST